MIKGNEDDRLRGTILIRELVSLDTNPLIQKVIDADLVPFLIEFLESDNSRLQLEAAWALTNIASGNKAQSGILIKYDAVPKFIKLLNSDNIELKEQAIWALGNLAGEKDNRSLILKDEILNPLIE